MNGAEAAGRLIGFAIVLAVPVLMIVAGNRRKTQTGGQRGKSLVIGGIILLVLVVFGILGQAATQISTAP